MNKLKIILAIILIIIGVIGRFILVSYAGIPNLEIITALALVSGIYLGGVYAVIIPLSIIFLSDLIIGNNYIFIFTWTAFALIGLFGYIYGKLPTTNYQLPTINIKLKKQHPCHSREGGNPVSAVKYRFQDSIALALLSSVFFYLYTNFGWWLMSGMYEYSLSGLMRCYWMAIPFFRNNLLGNLIFVPAGIYVASKVFCIAREKKVKLNCKIVIKS